MLHNEKSSKNCEDKYLLHLDPYVSLLRMSSKFHLGPHKKQMSFENYKPGHHCSVAWKVGLAALTNYGVGVAVLLLLQ